MYSLAISVAGIFLVLHGLIHLLGTAVYLKWAKFEGLRYKTTLAGGRWDLGDRGIRLFGAIWVLPAVGFTLSGVALLAGWAWWQPLLVAATLLSLALTVLDWQTAFAGAVIDILVLVVLLVAPLVSG